MRRRDFLNSIAGTAIAWPIGAYAQQARRVPRIGVLWNYKVNADIYLRRLQEQLTERHQGIEFVWRAKPTASKPMELKRLAVRSRRLDSPARSV